MSRLRLFPLSNLVLPCVFLLAVTVTNGAWAKTVEVQVGGPNGLQFNPAQVTIEVGDTVRWTNQGGGHNVNSDDGLFGNAVSTDAWVFEHTFNEVGNFGYHCQPHIDQGMTGGVTVEEAQTELMPGSLSLSRSSYSVNEGDGAVRISVERTGGSDGDASVAFATSDASATVGLDYSPANGTLNWGDGDTQNKTFDITIIDDGEIENEETLSVTLSAPAGAPLADPSSATVRIMDNDAEIPEPSSCTADATTLCLGDGDRFKVTMVFNDGTSEEVGQAQDIGKRDSGLMFFFNPDNVEFLVKILNGCPINDRFWVFFAATTDREFTLSVTDTLSGQTLTYDNELGMPANAITDTDAFDTCGL